MWLLICSIVIELAFQQLIHRKIQRVMRVVRPRNAKTTVKGETVGAIEKQFQSAAAESKRLGGRRLKEAADHGTRMLHCARMSRTVVAVDLGGTKALVARVAVDSWTIESQERIDTKSAEGFAAVLDDVCSAIERQRTPETVSVGIGVPGLVSKGILLNAPNIKNARNIDVAHLMTQRLSLPVHVGNDANCFALAEARMGAAKGKGIVVGITFGTGVGGGIVIDGKVFEGAHGYAAEIGHMLMLPGSPPYETDDKRGEVEQFLSGTAMGKRCEAAQSPDDYLEGAVCSFMQPAIYREVAWLCTNLLYLLDPDLIVFGGSAGHALTKHVDAIEAELQKWILPGTPLPKIVAAEIKNAGVLGAALLCA